MNLVVVCGMVMHLMVILSMIKIIQKTFISLALFCCLLYCFGLFSPQLFTTGAIDYSILTKSTL